METECDLWWAAAAVEIQKCSRLMQADRHDGDLSILDDNACIRRLHEPGKLPEGGHVAVARLKVGNSSD